MTKNEEKGVWNVATAKWNTSYPPFLQEAHAQDRHLQLKQASEAKDSYHFDAVF